MEIKILFILRSDAAIKGGGDIVQANAYKKEIELALKCTVYFAHELSKCEISQHEWDLIQVFNISRIKENVAAIDGVKFKNLILSPILQPGFGSPKKISIKSIIRSIIFSKPKLKNTFKNPKNLVNLFDAFVFLSSEERAEFFTIYPECSSKRHVVYENGIPDGFYCPPPSRPFDFITVGRIEPKKRTIETIDSVSSEAPQSTLICIGGLNWYHPIYCFRFILKVINGKAIYLGKRKPSDVYALMRNTKTLLNFSELEVSPLVDLEALACGCKVISTIYSYSHIPSSKYFSRIDVKNNEHCKQAIKISLSYPKDAPKEAPKITGVKTWHENSQKYIETIKDITNTSTSRQLKYAK